VAIQGFIEFGTDDGILAGWVRDSDDLQAELELETSFDGTVIAYGRPEFQREDLQGTFGYNITLGRHIHLFDLLAGRLIVRARSSASPGLFQLQLTDRMRDLAIEAFLKHQVGSLDQDLQRRFFSYMTTAAAALGGVELSVPLTQQVDRERMEETLRQLPPVVRAEDTPSLLGLPPGLLSSDASALLGHDGYLFLIGGSNAVLDQYLVPEDAEWLGTTASRWTETIRLRKREAAARNVGYLQIVIPEKLGVARRLFPREIPSRSRLLHRLESGVAASNDLADRFISASSVLADRADALLELAFPKTDSHLSFAGNFAVFNAIVAKMGLTPPPPPERLVRSRIHGDLAERFFGVPLFDEIMLPGEADTARLSAGMELVETHAPEGGHIGIRYVWRNPQAPFPQRVVAFGNSFFERGGDARCLSWWFARSFAEFHFVWHPDVDYAYVDAVKPDWLLAQTIERFLPIVPKA